MNSYWKIVPFGWLRLASAGFGFAQPPSLSRHRSATVAQPPSLSRHRSATVAQGKNGK